MSCIQLLPSAVPPPLRRGRVRCGGPWRTIGDSVNCTICTGIKYYDNVGKVKRKICYLFLEKMHEILFCQKSANYIPIRQCFSDLHTRRTAACASHFIKFADFLRLRHSAHIIYSSISRRLVLVKTILFVVCLVPIHYTVIEFSVECSFI